MYTQGAACCAGGVTTREGPLRDWLDKNLESVPEQKNSSLSPEYDIEGVGSVRISKRTNSHLPGLHVARTVPTNVDFRREGTDTMNKALEHKAGALAKYRQDGYISITLLDSRDIALTNQVDQYKAFIRATRQDPRNATEDVWLADVLDSPNETYIDFFCFRAHPDVMKATNAADYMFGPKHDAYWEEFLKKEDETP